MTDIKVHVMTVRYISRIARLRKYANRNSSPRLATVL